ncbi:dynein light chain Tctex-type 1 isoform X1 [Takifugu flavidus]|uniref:dynein light chain Tctex-type 1 isoform X1 n=1 Tax=Takifugu flavidus TaxID=433684 RepID=UPI002544C288|nr:dynein light chain Tctex-type 1 isoform X1 [Takifugu flavidus]XP_056873799.1 dynein light chain Tctex-type 1 isoform X1 [Takifugu flavidus]
MDEAQTEVATTFVVEEVSKIIKESIEATIGGNPYQHTRVTQWTSSVVELVLGQLSKLGKPFKYIVNCIIMQKNGAGLQTANTCFWDNSTDGNIRHMFLTCLFFPHWVHCCRRISMMLEAQFHFPLLSQTGSCAVRWENKSMYCIVTVFGLAI